MTMALAKDDTTKAIARPLTVLVPLIKKELAAAEKASIENYLEVGSMLLEAQQRMKDDGTFYKKGSITTGIWGRWLEKNFNMSEKTSSNYMRYAESESTADPALRRFHQ
jgi:hypothetical protein